MPTPTPMPTTSDHSDNHSTAAPSSAPGSASGSALGTALNIIGTGILVLCIVLCLSLAVPRFFGITSYAVISGSMEPAIPVGSMVCVKGVDPSTLFRGDIVMFYDGISEVPVTHRLVENDPVQGYIITQGDANAAPDLAPVLYPNIIGKVIFHVPLAGLLLSPLGTLWGKFCLICIIIGAMLLSLAGRQASRAS